MGIQKPGRKSLSSLAKRAGIASLAALIISVFVPDSFTSTVRMLPKAPASRSSMSSLLGVAAAFGLTSDSDPSTNYIDIIQSRWMADRLLNKEYTWNESWFFFLKRKPQRKKLYDYIGKDNIDLACKKLNDLIEITKDMKTGLVTINVTTRSPELSYQVAQDITANLQEFLQKIGQSEGAAKAEYTANRVKEAEEAVAQSEKAMYQFLSVNRNYQVSDDPKVRIDGDRLNADLTLRRQILTNLVQAKEQAILEQKDDTPILVVLDGGSLPIEKKGPARVLIAVIVGVLTALGMFLARYWGWIKSMLIDEVSE